MTKKNEMELSEFLEKLADIIASKKRPLNKHFRFHPWKIWIYENEIIQLVNNFSKKINFKEKIRNSESKDGIMSILFCIYAKSSDIASTETLNCYINISKDKQVHLAFTTYEVSCIRFDPIPKHNEKLLEIAQATYPFFKDNMQYPFQEFLDILDKKYLVLGKE